MRKDIRNNGAGEFVKGGERERRWKKIAELRDNVNVKRERMDETIIRKLWMMKKRNATKGKSLDVNR